MRAWILVVLISAFLSGCTTLGGNKISVIGSDGEKQEIPIDPIHFVGIEWTDALQEGNFQVYLINFPLELFAEYHPLRVRYNAMVYEEKSGKEYRAQAIPLGFLECGFRMALIVEGNPGESAVGVLTNTRFNRMFSLYGDLIRADSEKLPSDAVYRREVVLSGGTLLRHLNPFPGWHSELRSWKTAFRLPGSSRVIHSPFEEKMVRLVSRENPEINFVEKCVGNCSFGISIPPTWPGIMFSAASDVLSASSATCKSWDEQCEVTRGYQGVIPQVILAQLKAALNNGMVCGAGQKRQIKY